MAVAQGINKKTVYKKQTGLGAPAAGSGLDRVLARHEDRVHRRMGRMLRQLREALGEAL